MKMLLVCSEIKVNMIYNINPCLLNNKDPKFNFQIYLLNDIITCFFTYI